MRALIESFQAARTVGATEIIVRTAFEIMSERLHGLLMDSVSESVAEGVTECMVESRIEGLGESLSQSLLKSLSASIIES